MSVGLNVGMCMLVQVCTEDREVLFSPGAGVRDGCEPPGVISARTVNLDH